MQYIHESCLYSILLTSVITSQTFFPIRRDKQINHPQSWSQTYDDQQARVCLYYSLLTTSTVLFDPKRIPPFPDNVQVIPFVYPSCPTRLVGRGLATSPLSQSSVMGYLLEDEQSLTIIFSGTYNACLTEGDLDYHQVSLNIHNSQPGVFVHRGIYAVYQSIREEVLHLIGPKLGKQVVITGHSMGGALAQLCALELAYYQPIVYAFASPMIFNPSGGELFEKLLSSAYRITNSADLVCMSPLPIMPNGQLFVHVGQPMIFQKNLGNYTANHSQAYMDRYKLTYHSTTLHHAREEHVPK